MKLATLTLLVLCLGAAAYAQEKENKQALRTEEYFLAELEKDYQQLIKIVKDIDPPNDKVISAINAHYEEWQRHYVRQCAFIKALTDAGGKPDYSTHCAQNEVFAQLRRVRMSIQCVNKFVDRQEKTAYKKCLYPLTPA